MASEDENVEEYTDEDFPYASSNSNDPALKKVMDEIKTQLLSSQLACVAYTDVIKKHETIIKKFLNEHGWQMELCMEPAATSRWADYYYVKIYAF